MFKQRNPVFCLTTSLSSSPMARHSVVMAMTLKLDFDRVAPEKRIGLGNTGGHVGGEAVKRV